MGLCGVRGDNEMIVNYGDHARRQHSSRPLEVTTTRYWKGAVLLINSPHLAKELLAHLSTGVKRPPTAWPARWAPWVSGVKAVPAIMGAEVVIIIRLILSGETGFQAGPLLTSFALG